jgi:hypothetical protein
VGRDSDELIKSSQQYRAYFLRRKLAIATMHRKELVIAPKVASALRVLPFVPSGLDTDQFGTFSGEIARKVDVLATARRKCEVAMDLAGVDLAIASEGSFGMAYTAVPVDEEIVMLVDRKHGLEVVEKTISHQTNFSAQLCRTTAELMAFAAHAAFPTHALILRNQANSAEKIFKGIADRADLLTKFSMLVDTYGHAYVETDMRAQHNPMRMDVISKTTDALIARLMSCCDKCNAPGFGITDCKLGLPCKQCGQPTRAVSMYILSCAKCGDSRQESNRDKTFEDPMFCDRCNP